MAVLFHFAVAAGHSALKNNSDLKPRKDFFFFFTFSSQSFQLPAAITSRANLVLTKIQRLISMFIQVIGGYVG